MSDTITFPLSGLSCASCVRRAETAISGVHGVSQASVNLATSAATVTVERADAAPDIAGALTTAGYPAVEKTVTLALTGLSCASCVRRAETALKAVPGVVSASVNLASGLARVEVLDGTASPQALAEAVTAAGYAAEVQGDSAPQAAADRRAEEAESLRRRTLLSAVLTLPVFLLAMGPHVIPALHGVIGGTLGHQTSWAIQFVLTTVVLAGPGRGFFIKGVPGLLRGAPDMNALVALGTAAAWIYSTAALFLPGLFPDGTRAVYYEAAAVICTLILLGRTLEARAKGRTGAAIERLIGLQPATARVERDGAVAEVPLAEVTRGDVLHIRPGERLPADGVVLTGEAYVDESMITGEPVPVAKGPGAPVTGGTVNGTSALTVRAEAVGEATVLAQIIRMVEAAQGAKLPIQSLVDRITAIFVPVVMGLAALTVAVWLAVGPDPALALALVAGVSVLIIACPCAMGLATPTSIMVGTGRAAELGVLFRKGEALQVLEGVKVVALDKTGTLTEGAPELTSLQVAGGRTEAEVLPLIAAVEAASEHPIARAIVRAAERGGDALPVAEGVRAITGMGARGTVGGRDVLIGADRYMAAEDIDLGDLAKVGAAIAERGETPLYAAIDGVAVAAIGVSDPVKADTPAALAALKAEGLTIAMITGDNAATAKAIARRLGIDEVVAEVLPDGKVAALARLRKAHGPIAFVGDGINDAPALAEAEVGIAIGTGTDVAIEAADVVLMSGALSGVANALAVSRATMRNIRQNLFWAFAYNAALIPVAAGVIYPVTGHLLSPMLAAGAMAISSVFVISNALRLRRVAPRLAETSAMPPAPVAGLRPAPAE